MYVKQRVVYSVVECTDEGDSPFDPVSLVAFCGKLHSDHIVGGMTGGGQSPCKKNKEETARTASHRWQEDLSQYFSVAAVLLSSGGNVHKGTRCWQSGGVENI